MIYNTHRRIFKRFNTTGFPETTMYSRQAGIIKLDRLVPESLPLIQQMFGTCEFLVWCLRRLSLLPLRQYLLGRAMFIPQCKHVSIPVFPTPHTHIIKWHRIISDLVGSRINLRFSGGHQTFVSEGCYWAYHLVSEAGASPRQ